MLKLNKNRLKNLFKDYKKNNLIQAKIINNKILMAMWSGGKSYKLSQTILEFQLHLIIDNLMSPYFTILICTLGLCG